MRGRTQVTLTGYGPPVSPHLAAELSGRPVDAADLRAGVLAAAAIDEAASVRLSAAA